MELNRAEHITGSCIATAVQWEIPQITMYPLNSHCLSSYRMCLSRLMWFKQGAVWMNVAAFSSPNYTTSNLQKKKKQKTKNAATLLSLNPLILSYRNRLMVSVCRWSWICYNRLGFFCCSFILSLWYLFPCGLSGLFLPSLFNVFLLDFMIYRWDEVSSGHIWAGITCIRQ